MVVTKVQCYKCGNIRQDFKTLCEKCGSPFIIKASGHVESRIQDNYDYFQESLLPMNNPTPLVRTDAFSAKLEYFSPTLSYKDRGMNTLFSHLKGCGYLKEGDEVSEDSSGNAGASFSLLCHMSKVRGTVFVSSGANRMKVGQIKSYGSSIETVKGDRKSVETAALKSDKKYLGHQYWPEFYDGFRAISYEIHRQCNEIPANILIPFSTGTLYLGIFEGFVHLFQNGLIRTIPTLWAIQPEVASGMYDYLNGIEKAPQRSIADALTGILPLRHEYLASIIRMNGRCETISEDEIISAKQDLLKYGIDCEYSSAITYAALRKFDLDSDTLLILTGHGIKNISPV